MPPVQVHADKDFLQISGTPGGWAVNITALYFTTTCSWFPKDKTLFFTYTPYFKRKDKFTASSCACICP
jgi:hypothetical protein